MEPHEAKNRLGRLDRPHRLSAGGRRRDLVPCRRILRPGGDDLAAAGRAVGRGGDPDADTGRLGGSAKIRTKV